MGITRTAWTDDDGSGTTGTIINNSEKTTLYDQIDGRWSELTTTSTGTQNNFSITSGGIEADVLRCNNASLLTLTGIVAPASPVKPGKKLIVYSVGAGRVDLAHENGSSTAANRFVNQATSAASSLAPGKGWAVYVYDDAADRWRMIAHDQGAFITPTFTAGDFTGNASMTWTVESADRDIMGYRLVGKFLHVTFHVATTTVGGTPSTVLQIGNAQWGGFTAALSYHTGWALDNGTPQTNLVTPNGTVIQNWVVSTGNWTASTNNTLVSGTILFEVT